jgi:hypothetical protein
MFPTLPVGTYEDALAMVGFEQEIRYSEVPASQSLIAYFCALLEDPNPSYWDAGEAERLWGSLVAPPAMMHVWLMPLPWRPQGADTRFALAMTVPLPGSDLINVGVDCTYERHVRVGDELSVIERLDSVGPEKTTRLGTGHFIVTTATYRNGAGDLIGTLENTLFRYEPATKAPAQREEVHA